MLIMKFSSRVYTMVPIKKKEIWVLKDQFVKEGFETWVLGFQESVVIKHFLLA